MATENLYILLLSAMLAAQFISAQDNDVQDSSSQWLGSISENHSRSGIRKRQINILVPQGICDYSKEPDWTCFNSTSQQFCMKNNLLFIFDCTVDRPFCSDGHCCRNSNCLT